MSTQEPVVYGIKTCDTCRKALKWLQAENIPHTWVDLRTGDGVPAALIERLVAADMKGELKAINKSSKTWRDMDDVSREAFTSGTVDARVALLTQSPLLIKRPLVVHKDQISCGFTPELQAHLAS